MVATATIVGQTFVNIYKEYVYLGYNLNNNQLLIQVASGKQQANHEFHSYVTKIGADNINAANTTLIVLAVGGKF